MFYCHHQLWRSVEQHMYIIRLQNVIKRFLDLTIYKWTIFKRKWKYKVWIDLIKLVRSWCIRPKNIGVYAIYDKISNWTLNEIFFIILKYKSHKLNVITSLLFFIYQQFLTLWMLSNSLFVFFIYRLHRIINLYKILLIE